MEVNGFFTTKQIKKPRLYLERSRSKEKHLTSYVSCFPLYTSFVLYRFLRALQQKRAQSIEASSFATCNYSTSESWT